MERNALKVQQGEERGTLLECSKDDGEVFFKSAADRIERNSWRV